MIRLISTLLCVYLLTGCVFTRSEGEQLRSDLNRLRDEVASMQRQQGDAAFEIHQNLQKISGKAESVEDAISSKQKLDAKSMLKTEEMQQEIRLLLGSLEELQHEIKLLKETQEKFVQKTNEKKTDLSVPSGKKEHYEKAKLFYDQKNYVLAIKLFDEFIDKYKKDKSLLDNAYFWRGDSYFNLAKKEKSSVKKKELRRKSIVSYQKVLTDFPKSNKSDVALYRIGLSMETLGFSKDALVFYEEIVSKHPKSNLAKSAKSKIKKIKETSKKQASAKGKV